MKRRKSIQPKKLVFSGDVFRKWDIIVYNPGNPKRGKDRTAIVIDKIYDGMTTLTVYPFTQSRHKRINKIRVSLIQFRVWLGKVLP